MTSLGAVFRPQLPPERLRGVARAADEAGLAELWLWEDCFLESGVASAAAALAWTERLRVGVGLLPVPLRNAALTAMEAATLHRLFPGRFRMGVGHGVQSWMAQVGARVDSPVTLLREHLVVLRALLRGERVTTTGSHRYVRLDGVALDWPPAAGTAPAVLAGARGPRSLRLAGEAADGVILDRASAESVRAACESVTAGWQAAGRAGRGPEVVAYLPTALAATGERAEERLRAELARRGAGDVGDAGVAGDADTVAEAVRRLAVAGAHTVVLEPTPDEPDPEGFVRFAAEEVRPRVR